MMLPAVADQYLVIRILSWVEAIATLVFVFFVLQALFDMAKRHTSVDYGEDPELSARATARLHTDLWRRSLWALIAFGTSAVAQILEVEFQPIYGWIWLVQAGCSVIAVLLFYSCLNRLAEAIEDRYPAKRRA